jgi:hypothetical protein
MGFDPCNYSMKIWDSIGTLTLKVGVHLGVWGSFPHTLIHSQEHECDSQTSFLARTFTSPYLDHKPKVSIVTQTTLHVDQSPYTS